MGSSKAAPMPPHVVFRDHDDAASASSALLLDDINYPDEEPPAYSDDLPPQLNTPALNQPFIPRAHFNGPPPELPFSTHDLNRSEERTTFPTYSTDSKALYDMILAQSKYPPQYFVELQGTHEETRRNGNKDTKERITDFHIRINITNLLVPDGPLDTLRLLPDNERGYRGGRIISHTPSLIDDMVGVGTNAELQAWCERYVADSASIKAFTFKREVTNHDRKKLTQLLRSAIQETNYRGHLRVDFTQQHQTLVIYSPGVINTWRTTVWIRWVFYISMLWIITWPLLILLTARYETVKAVFPYANKKPGDDVDRVPTVMSEVAWFNMWQSAIRRAALSRMRCEGNSLDEDYRFQAEEADRRAMEYARAGGVAPNTGNTFSDGALGFLAQTARIAGEFNNIGGWGGDTY